ncbi:uncharacterized protein LOC124810514 isoform X1 [Hydra vulgaris]|uniref:uncharacterized protein LOC124810514 isoform X1 n=1 Tax=Hydra vulgaris TaxID=6087 RepID=UPI001F5FAF7C|nr:uncharacterized protein LOC124810514 isoform X1 [Hydra vulgaris]XP_047131462.1 uncharacterized protein LOC124810514 isoform X1 [Hydra vulgaris]
MKSDGSPNNSDILSTNKVWNFTLRTSQIVIPILSENESILECKGKLDSQISKISDVIENWVQYVSALHESYKELYKFCFDIKTLLPHHFDTLKTFPDYYRTYFDGFISDYNKNKSNNEEIVKMATIICHITKDVGLSNQIVLKQTFSEFIEPELTAAISLLEKSLILTKNDFVSTEILIDNVPCFYAPFWPDAASFWVNRNRFWPDSQLVGSIYKNGFHIVPKSLPDGDERLEWQLSFSAAESVLSLHRSEKQNYIYFLFKSLFYKYVKTYSHEKSLPTYICKTVMMWACEQQPQSWWEQVSPENGVLFLIRKFVNGIKKKVIKHYFIEGLNLLEHFPSFILVLTELNLFSLITDLVKKLNALLKSMSAGINIVYENLIKKQTHSLKISVAFLYQQKIVSKLNFALESLVKLFWYYFLIKRTLLTKKYHA